MKKFIQNNIVLLLAFLLPIALIGVIGLSAYLPSLSVYTDYDFLYAACSDGSEFAAIPCNNSLKERYSVENDKLVITELDSGVAEIVKDILDNNEQHTIRIFLHDTQKNESREIAKQEAQKLKLSGLLASPDGVTVTNHSDSNPGIFPFIDGASSANNYYLTKGKSKSNKKLNLIGYNERNYYRGNIKIIGWVLPSANQQ